MIELWKEIFIKNNINITNLEPESESEDYFACDAKYEKKNAKFRIAKTTPKKVGQFVTLWKRIENLTIQPFNPSDKIDFVLIAVQNNDKFGLFVFPKSVLFEKGIFTDKKEGKRAIRVYTPWDIVENSQAKKTQKWMLNYFQELN